MANFYGALTVQQAFRIIEQQNPGLTTQDEVSAVLHREEDDAASATSAWKARSTEMKPYLTTQRLLEKFLLLYTELHNTTRMPENYGHTPEELFESERIRRVVGRNDPCPCGSGKKYKKCCGRNVN